jgi:hypothetical protein
MNDLLHRVGQAVKVRMSVVAVLVALGAAALWYGSSRAAIENNEPVHLPYPAPGFTVTDSFHLAAGGRFALQVATPASAHELTQLHRGQPDVPCIIEVTLRGPQHFVATREISSFHNGGWSDQNLYYPNDVFILPRGGEYELSLRSKAGGEVFATRGAIVTLQRWENIGSAIGWMLARWLGYGSLACAAILSFVGRGNESSTNRPPN